MIQGLGLVKVIIPVDVLLCIREHAEVIVPLLLRTLRDEVAAAAGMSEDTRREDESRKRCFFAFMILHELQQRSYLPILLGTLGLPGERSMITRWDDTVCETVEVCVGIFAGMDELDAIDQIIVDAQANEYSRSAYIRSYLRLIAQEVVTIRKATGRLDALRDPILTPCRRDTRGVAHEFIKEQVYASYRLSGELLRTIMRFGGAPYSDMPHYENAWVPIDDQADLRKLFICASCSSAQR
ncbi:MAG: DUF1186 domain-containing protein [Planctomycetota bacterium]